MPVRFSLAGRAFAGSGFLFDKDGTLLAFDHWWAVMRERARRLATHLSLAEVEKASLLRFMGMDPTHSGGTNHGIIPLPRCDAEAATAAYLAQVVRAEVEEMRHLTVRVFQEVDEEFPFDRYIRPTAGAETGLRAIQRAGGRTAVVTHDTAAAALRHLAALGWTELVDAVIGLDVCAERKPDPKPVFAACHALGLDPEETVMVGDMPTDLLAGRAAGCRLTVGVLTGLGTEDDLSPVADVVVPDLAALSVSGPANP
jgi:HAD superfamily hydrolase (TIGR01509 family)